MSEQQTKNEQYWFNIMAIEIQKPISTCLSKMLSKIADIYTIEL